MEDITELGTDYSNVGNVPWSGYWAMDDLGVTRDGWMRHCEGQGITHLVVTRLA